MPRRIFSPNSWHTPQHASFRRLTTATPSVCFVEKHNQLMLLGRLDSYTRLYIMQSTSNECGMNRFKIDVNLIEMCVQSGLTAGERKKRKNEMNNTLTLGGHTSCRACENKRHNICMDESMRVQIKFGEYTQLQSILRTYSVHGPEHTE